MSQELLSARVLRRSLGWNATATLLPLAAAVLAVPLLIDGMGTERFGLLTIVWALVGYASLFDLGLGRALTLLVAARLGQGEGADGGDARARALNPLLWTALAWLAALGLLACAVLWLAAPALVRVLQTPPTLVSEAVTAFRVLAVGLPLVFVTSAFTGVLMALQRFDELALVRLPLGLVTTLGPLLTLLISPSLVWVALLMLLARGAAAAAFAWRLWRLVPIGRALMRPERPRAALARQLLGQGGWMTVSNVVGPLLTYLDRFVVGALLGTAAVAWYVTPYEVLGRLTVLPGILLGVLFPALATAFASDPARARALYGDAAVVLRHALGAVCLLVLLFAEALLAAWIDAGFARQAAPVAQWLAVGIWINVVGHTPFTFLQGIGRADLIAKVHLAELLPYLALMAWWTHSHGIAGTAAAWTVRVLADTLLLNLLVRRVHPPLAGRVTSELRALALGLAAFGGAAMLEPPALRLALLALAAAHAAWVLWPYAQRLLRREGRA
jgi:O-antigen/teichoic acid export membrane protein